MSKEPNYYDEKYFTDRDHLDLHIAESIKILASEYKLKRILDIGCGSGKLVKFFNYNGFEAIGCDNQEVAVSMARKLNKGGVIKIASATKLPFKNSSFNLVTSISVIEHLTKTQGKKLISEAKRVLTTNGFVFIITPNFNSPIRYILGNKWFGYSDPTHKHFYTPKSLSKLLKKGGFKSITTRPKTAYNVTSDLHLPSFLRSLPTWAKNILNYLMISSPLSTLRDSFWIVGQKN